MKSQSINALRNDHLSGASRLTYAGMKTLIGLIQEDVSETPEELCDRISRIVQQLVLAQPYMASIRNLVQRILQRLETLRTGAAGVSDIRDHIVQLLKEENRRHMRALLQLGEIGIEIINPHVRVLTYSHSGSVKAVFNAAVRNRIPFSVILSEARPNNEGIDFAKKLAKSKIPTILVIDVHLLHYLLTAHCVIIGADWISESQFTNKIGTALIVDHALKQKLPIYVAAATDKMLAQKYYPLTVDEQTPDEIVKTRSKYLTVKNRFFEAVPITDEIKFITERGILNQEEIINIVERSQ